MLKIMKNDILAYKKFGLAYIIMVALILISIGIINIIPEYLEVAIPLSIMLFYFLIMAFSFLIFAFIVYYFYKTTFSNSAYINFKLGISRNKVILARMANAFLLNLFSALIGIGFLALLFYSITNHTNKGFAALASEIINSSFPSEFGQVSINWIFTYYAIMVFIGLISSVVKIYLALAIGHMANKNKKIFSFLAYIGMGIVEGIISSIVMISYMAFVIERFVADKVNGFPRFMYSTLSATTIMLIIFMLIEGFLLFRIVNKKLNV